MATDRISVRIPPKQMQFVEKHGGRSDGTRAAIEFAQVMPTTFALWMTGAANDWDTIDKVTAFGISQEVQQCAANA